MGKSEIVLLSFNLSFSLFFAFQKAQGLLTGWKNGFSWCTVQ